MNIIKFSYPFHKLFHNGQQIEVAKLLQVVRVKLEDLSQELRDYDTDFGAYQLPLKGDYLMLIFLQGHTRGLFTTLRRETPSKLAYYMRSVGEVFNVEVSHNIKPQ